MSFATGFANNVASGMRDKKEFIRNRVEEDRLYLRQQGLQRQAAITEQKLRYQQATEQLLRIQGVDKNRVLAALEADPDGVLDLAGRDFTDGSQINTVLDIYDGAEASGSLTDILGRVMPAFSSLPKDANPTTVKRAGIAAWLGLDTETELNEQVYQAQIVGGMTGDDILASMNIPVTARGTGARGMNYEGVADPLTSAQKQSHFNDMVPEYDALLAAEIDRVQQMELSETFTADDKMKQVEELRALGTGPVDARLSKLLEKFGPTDNSKAFFETYGEGLFGPGMARFFTVTGEDNPENTQDITTTELPEADAEGDTATIAVRTEEEIQSAVEEFVKDNPTATEVTVSGPDGVVTIPLEPTETEEAEETTPTVRPGGGSGSLAGVIVDFFTKERPALQIPENAPGRGVVPNRSGDGSTAPQGIMSRGPSTPQPPEIPEDMSDDDFSRMVAAGIVPSQRKVLDEGRIARYPEPTPNLENAFQGRPDTVKALISNPDMEIDPDLIETVFEDLGIRVDTTFGNRLVNMLARDFKPEDRKAALEFILNQYSLFEDRP